MFNKLLNVATCFQKKLSGFQKTFKEHIDSFEIRSFCHLFGSKLFINEQIRKN